MIEHDRAQRAADVGEELHAFGAAKAFVVGHAQETFVHQRGGVEAGDAAGFGESRAGDATDVRVKRGVQLTDGAGFSRRCSAKQTSDIAHANGGVGRRSRGGAFIDRKSVVQGKSVGVRVEQGGGGDIK